MMDVAGNRNRWMSSRHKRAKGKKGEQEKCGIASLYHFGNLEIWELGSFGIRLVGIVESLIFFERRQLNSNVIPGGLLQIVAQKTN